MNQLSVGNGAVINGDSNTIICSLNISGVLPTISKLQNESTLQTTTCARHMWFVTSAKKHNCE